MLTGRYPLKNLRMGSRRQTSVPVIESFDLKPGRILARKYEVVQPLGGGWEGRSDADMIDVQTRDAMTERTDWGDLIENETEQ